jgi:RsiW-degrading membrane proteinase PrsW (M82 family)
MAALLALITPFVALAVSLLVIWTIRYLDVVEREPRKMIAKALGIGCLTAIAASFWGAIPEMAWKSLGLGDQFVDFMTTVFDAPIWEELIKGAGLVCLYRSNRNKFDSLTDFVVYACAVAIGFELIENILYQWAQLEGKDQFASWIDELNGRILGSAGTHAIFSAWLGLAFWIWIRSKTAYRFALSAVSVLVSMGLHAGNNFAAVLQQYGPPNETLPINRLGTLFAMVNNQIALAMFLALIIICILRDIFFLSDYSYQLLPRLDEQKPSAESFQHIASLRELMNPINHVVAASEWSWRLLACSDRVIRERALFRKFARLAMAPARAGSTLDSGKHFDRHAWIKAGVELVVSAT